LRPVYLISKTSYPGVIHIPALTIRFLTPHIDFSQYEGVILTSKQTVLALRNYAIDWCRLKCICVSEPTAQSAREAGAVDIETGDGYGTSIPDVLQAKKRNGKWLYLRPKTVASEWVETAREKGFVIDEAVVYETTCNEEVSDLEAAKDGVLIFTSPSSIRCYTKHHPIFPAQDVVVIGKTTQSALPAGVSSRLSATTSIASAVELARQIAREGENSSPF